MTPQRGWAQRVARTVGTTFFVVGCLGFVPGVTVDVEQIPPGPGSATPLLGLVPVTVAGNVVQLVFAVPVLLCRRSDVRARGWLVWAGALYVALCARGPVIGTGISATTPDAHRGLWVGLAAGDRGQCVRARHPTTSHRGFVSGRTLPTR